MIVFKKLIIWGNSANPKTPISSTLSKPFGFGQITSKQLLCKFGLPFSIHSGLLFHLSRETLSRWLKYNSVVLRALQKMKSSRLADLSRFGSKKSLRRSMGLPVNGQRTRSNAQTVRYLLRFRRKFLN